MRSLSAACTRVYVIRHNHPESIQLFLLYSFLSVSPSYTHHKNQGYGIAAYPDTNVTPSTLFYGGSTTKAFTAAAMSLLVDDNANFSNVQWHTPIVRLIPNDFALSDEYATTHTTIEDALSHRSGLPRHDYSYGGNYDGQKPSIKGSVRAMRHLPWTAEPRTKFQYCNQMYAVASHVIETLTGSWLGDVLKERIWGPLNMKATVSLLFTYYLAALT
jgi:CubicO group peptidase (beta-lactamase class C family)